MGKAEFSILLGELFIGICIIALIIGLTLEVIEDILSFIKKRRNATK